MDRTLILCAGLPRSGSTWLYNVVRLAMSDAVGAPAHGAWVDDYDPDHPAPVHVVKLHRPDDRLAARADAILTTHRDLRDIAASALRRGWIADAAQLVRLLDDAVDGDAFWSPRADREIVYERMMEDRPREIRAILRALAAPCDEGRVGRLERAVDALAPGEMPGAYDAVTLLHSEHRTDGRCGYYAEVLPAVMIRLINRRYARWLADRHYV